MYKISRYSQMQVAVVAISTALSNTVGFGGFAGGGFITPSALTATTKIGFKVSSEENGTYVGLYNSAGSLLEVTVDLSSSRAYPFPDELFAWPWFKIWCQASGSDVNQAAARTFTLVLKG